jgi:hypothetical protein
MGFNSAFKGLRWVVDEADHSPPSSAKINVRFTVFRYGVRLVRYRDTFTFCCACRSLDGYNVSFIYVSISQILLFGG